MNKRRKAQISLEYLFIYGFGVLVVAISLFLAWQSGVFTNISPQKRGIGGFSQLIVEDFKAQNNSLNLTVKNNAPDKVRVMKANATIGFKLLCEFNSQIEIASGNKTKLNLTCLGMNEEYPPGKYFKADIRIEYLNIRSNQIHQSLGYIWGTTER